MKISSSKYYNQIYYTVEYKTIKKGSLILNEQSLDIWNVGYCPCIKKGSLILNEQSLDIWNVGYCPCIYIIYQSEHQNVLAFEWRQ